MQMASKEQKEYMSYLLRKCLPKNYETKEIFNDGTNAGIAVRIEAQDNKAYTYMWSLEKIQDDGPLKNNWMTTGVSGPRLLAEGS